MRLRDFDYAGQGAYFITICTANRRSLFGRVEYQEMRLNRLGRIVHACWRDLERHYANVALDYFVVMPNHIHGVIFLRGAERAGLKPAPTREVVPMTEVVRAFKTFSARRINEALGRREAVWQRNYYDRVIRNDRELNAIRDYIQFNPARWDFDRENPGCRAKPRVA
jgi:REP element-mobilizing transposase RayT